MLFFLTFSQNISQPFPLETIRMKWTTLFTGKRKKNNTKYVVCRKFYPACEALNAVFIILVFQNSRKPIFMVWSCLLAKFLLSHVPASEMVHSIIWAQECRYTYWIVMIYATSREKKPNKIQYKCESISACVSLKSTQIHVSFIDKVVWLNRAIRIHRRRVDHVVFKSDINNYPISFVVVHWFKYSRTL